MEEAAATSGNATDATQDVDQEPPADANTEISVETASGGDERAVESARSIAVPWKPLVLIAAAAFALRLVMIFVVHPMCPNDPDRWDDPALYSRDAAQYQAPADSSCITLRGDSAYLYGQGRMLAEGHGLSDPVTWVVSRVELPSARKPPGVVFVMAALDKVGLTSPDASRVVMAGFGAAAVLVLGRLGWRLFGRTGGCIVAVGAALHPVLVINDWRLLTESMAVLFFALGLTAVYRVWERPSTRAAAAVGLFFGLCTYARVEAPLICLLSFLPIVFALRQLSVSARARLVASMALAGFLVLTPFFLMNMVRFHHPSLFGPGTGWGLMNSSCDETWYGELTGYLSSKCFDTSTTLDIVDAGGLQAAKDFDESDYDVVYRDRAGTYVTDNASRIPAVAAARVGRVFGFYSPGQTTELETSVEERGSVEPVLTMLVFYASIPFAVIGAVAMRRRRVPLIPMIVPFALVAVMAAASFGLPRYRVFADVTLLLMAALGIVTAPAWYRHLRDRKSATVGTVEWWRPGTGPDRPVDSVVKASARATKEWRVPTFVVVGVSVVVAMLVLTVAWSAAVEPDKTIPGVAEPDRVELCKHLEKLRSIVEQVNRNPQLAVFIPAEIDAIERLGPESAKEDAKTIRRQITALAAAGAATPGAPPPTSPELDKAANQATSRLLRLAVRSC